MVWYAGFTREVSGSMHLDSDMNDEERIHSEEEYEIINQEKKSRKRGREKEWIESKNHENKDLPDPDSLPALLYQLTSVMRKCNGASTRLRALVLDSISEVSDIRRCFKNKIE